MCFSDNKNLCCRDVTAISEVNELVQVRTIGNVRQSATHSGSQGGIRLGWDGLQTVPTGLIFVKIIVSSYIMLSHANKFAQLPATHT